MKKVIVSSNREKVIVNEFEEAILNEGFHFVYQPKMDVLTKRLVGIEALIRWDNPALGVVSPGEFIPILEKHRHIGRIGNYTIRKNIEQASKWLKAGVTVESIAVNISPSELGNENFVGNIVGLCKKNNIPHNLIQLEITEQVNITTIPGAISTLLKLQELGFQLVIDDFGDGHSSELLSIGVPVDVLKIDKSLIDDLPINEKDVSQIIQLSKSLGYEVVAEGVETKEQLDILSKLGCSQIQGYYYSKPLEIDELIELLQHQK